MSFDIINTYMYFPKNVITNEHLDKINPNWKVKKLFSQSGVKRRYYTDKNQTSLDMALEACKKAKRSNKNFFKKIDGLIFCTQTQDHYLPSNSSILHGLLGLDENVFTIDINHGCSGFVYCLFLVNSLIKSNTCSNILVINADTYSKFINKKDRSTKILFSDAASATLIKKTNRKKLFDCIFGSSGKDYNKLIIPAGLNRTKNSKKTKKIFVDKSGNQRSKENIFMDGLGILSLVNSKVPMQIKKLLEKNHLKNSDIKFYIFHQASSTVIKNLRKQLSIDKNKAPELLENGNIVSATLPYVFNILKRTKKLKKNDTIIFSGFGVGISWASAVYTI